MAGQIDMNGPWGIGARALGFVPGPIGLVGALGSMGMRANNMGYTNAARRSWGQDGLDFGQTIGGLLGMNSYGGGGERDKLGDFRGVAVTPSGVATRGGLLGIGGTTTGAYTPGEAQKRAAAALYGSPFGTPRVGPVTPTPVQPTASVPSPAIMSPSRNDFGIRDMGRFRDDSDPIGAAIRSMGGASANGGGRSGGSSGGGGRSSGGGRSDRSSMSSGRG